MFSFCNNILICSLRILYIYIPRCILFLSIYAERLRRYYSNIFSYSNFTIVQDAKRKHAYLYIYCTLFFRRV